MAQKLSFDSDVATILLGAGASLKTISGERIEKPISIDWTSHIVCYYKSLKGAQVRKIQTYSSIQKHVVACCLAVR